MATTISSEEPANTAAARAAAADTDTEMDRGLFDAVGDAMLIVDPDTGLVVDANPAAADMFGYSREALIGLSPTATLHPDNHHLFEASLEASRAGRRYDAQAVSVRQDGTSFVTDLRATGLQFRGRPHLLLARRDVTERVQTRQVLEQRMAERTRELSTMLDVSRNVTSTLAVEPLVALILRQLQEVLDYTGSGIALLEGDALVLVEYIGPLPREEMIGWRAPYRPESELPSMVNEVARRREPVIIHDFWGDDPLPAAIRQIGDPKRLASTYYHSWLGVPLMVKDELIGLLWADHVEPNHFNEEHARLAMGVAGQAAVAIENARLFETEQRRAEQFQLIGEVGGQITSILNVDELLSRTARLIHETFGFHHVHLGLIEGDELRFKAIGGVWGKNSVCHHCDHIRPRVGRDGVTGWVAGTGEALVVPDVTKEPRYIPVVDQPVGSNVILPLKVRGKVIGVLDVESEQLNAFDEIDVAVLQSLADQVAVAIENARLFEAEQRSTDRFRAISELGQHINAILDVDELISRAVQLIQATFGFYHVHVGLIEDDRVNLPATAGVWESEPICSHCASLELHLSDEAICSRVAKSGAPLLVADISREPRYLHPTGATGSGVVVPLQVKGKVIGLLDVEHREVNAFDDFDVAVLQLLANQVAVAIENGRLYRQARSLAALQERQKLARELHDSVSQALYGMSLGAHTARALLERDPQAAAEPLDYVISLADAGLAEMRALIFELRPESLEIEGLVAALTKQADALRARHGLAVEADLAQEPEAGLEVKEALYRIAQEAMHNTVKHARASRLGLALRQRGAEVILEVQDDGIGFDPGGSFPGHLGLQSMRERVARLGGKVDVQSAPGRGTTVRAALPLAAAV